MPVFLTIALLLGILFAVHLIWWRMALPRKQRAALLALFLIGGLVLAPVVGFLLGLFGFAPLSLIQWLNVALAVVAFALAYVVTYSALEADSPTLSLVRHIAAAGQGGLAEVELGEFMASRPFVGARLTALVDEGMVYEKEDRILLADHPYTLFRMVLLHREKVLGLTSHGG
jgi:MFS family permease